jgi:hypothetical protein
MANDNLFVVHSQKLWSSKSNAPLENRTYIAFTICVEEKDACNNNTVFT